MLDQTYVPRHGVKATASYPDRGGPAVIYVSATDCWFARREDVAISGDPPAVKPTLAGPFHKIKFPISAQTTAQILQDAGELSPHPVPHRRTVAITHSN